MAGWANPLTLLREELGQRRDEGCEIPQALLARIGELEDDRDAWRHEVVDPLYDELMALPEDPELAAREPNDLSAIRAARPDGPRDLRWEPSDDDAIARFHGAWTGRAAGCALGKPVELMGVRAGRTAIRAYLEARDDWPLTEYFSGRDVGDGRALICPRSQREHITCMEPDDDIHYTLIALAVLEDHGAAFDWTDVAQAWCTRLPYSTICTAETQAVLSYMQASSRGWPRWQVATTPEHTRRHRNPYREWIGAQIRSDGWAWAAAGNPQLAAELAHRDAHWTHERNGIYGSMFFAALQSAAFVEDDPTKLVEIGLSEIPRHSRLALAVSRLLAEAQRGTPAHADSLVEWIEAHHGGLHPVHTINNALICVAALLAADEPIAAAVMSGLDTDCNGATVGSVVGARGGVDAIPTQLRTPLHDTIEPAVIGFSTVTMRELALRTHAVWRRLRDH